MKQTKIFILITIAAFFGNESFAQYKWAAGYQLGIGNSNLPTSLLTGEQGIDMNAMLTNQLFLKRKISRKLEVDVGFGFTSWKRNYLGVDNMNNFIESYTNKNIALNLTLTVKYNILQKKNWNLYIPFGMNNVYYKSNTDYDDMPTESWHNFESKGLQIGQNIFTGLDFNYDLNKRLYLYGQGITGYKLYNALQSFDKRSHGDSGNISYGFQGGIGYRF